jgi:hypothetical protein
VRAKTFSKGKAATACFLDAESAAWASEAAPSEDAQATRTIHAALSQDDPLPSCLRAAEVRPPSLAVQARIASCIFSTSTFDETLCPHKTCGALTPLSGGAQPSDATPSAAFEAQTLLGQSERAPALTCPSQDHSARTCKSLASGTRPSAGQSSSAEIRSGPSDLNFPG